MFTLVMRTRSGKTVDVKMGGATIDDVVDFAAKQILLGRIVIGYTNPGETTIQRFIPVREHRPYRAIRHLVPYPTSKELARAIKKCGDTHELSRAEFNEKLCGIIVAERVERAALVARMMSDA
jgi:hypothetical protein